MNTTPIEFMAWDKLHGIMTLPFELHKVNFTKCENWIPLQLTALRSINDEPIYNNMIVKDAYGIHYVVDMFNYEIMYHLSISFIEIVGNRFQHSELLELCK